MDETVEVRLFGGPRHGDRVHVPTKHVVDREPYVTVDPDDMRESLDPDQYKYKPEKYVTVSGLVVLAFVHGHPKRYEFEVYAHIRDGVPIIKYNVR